MHNTVSLSRFLISRGKRLAAHGMFRAASADLAVASASGVGSAEASGLQAEMSLRMGRFKAARRQAGAALAAAPTCPHYQYLCGLAWERGPGADPNKASNHYLECLELDPGHLRARCRLGLARVASGLVNEGLAILAGAWKSAPQAFDAFLALYRGLKKAGRIGEVRALVRSARFQLRGDIRFSAFLDRIRYRAAARRQRAGNPAEPVLLPFLRLADPVAPHPGERLRATTLRIDAAGTVQEPHAFRLRRRQRGRNA